MSVITTTIAQALGQYRLMSRNESALGRMVTDVLTGRDITFYPEHDLGVSYGRIDFFIPSDGLGIELKVKGSPGEVTAQLHRYALAPQINALMLVTGRVALGRLPRQLHGKPLTIVPTWRGGL